MTNEELASLRGEIFGLKILLMNCVSELAGRTGDPQVFLASLRKQAAQGILQTTPDNVKPAHMQTFRDSAAGIVVQVVSAADAVLTPTPPPNQLQ
jgi:hypothetical protein